MKKEFIKFLKSKRLWSKFRREFEVLNKTKNRTIFNYNNTTKPETYLSGAFYWSVTKEGHKYWNDIRYQWKKHLKTLNK